MPAILQNRDSMFDEPSWIALPPPEYISLNNSISRAEVAYFHEYNKLRSIKLARLVRLVRAARVAPENVQAQIEANKLAQVLYSDEIEPWVEGVMAKGIAKVVPSSSPLLESSLDFSSFTVHAFLATYWEFRIRICGLVIALSQIPAEIPFHHFDMAAVFATDVRTAQYIAMSTDYAIKVGVSTPFHIIRQVAPINTSFGAWNRLELRAGGESSISTDAVYAQKMKKWCVDTVAQFGTRFRLPPWSATYQWMLNQNDIFTGGLAGKIQWKDGTRQFENENKQ
jgi:hypothetical protein